MQILVGITGGIAAYKSAALIRLLTESGHSVKALPTQNALRFIGSATLEALSHNSVDPDLYSQVEDVKHIKLAQEADLVVVAPATAAFIARYANGIADDLLLNVLLATKAQVLIAPAMHSEMWMHPATQTNLDTLRARGVRVLEPEVGRLTGSDIGVGRMVEPETIFAAIANLNTPQDLSGKTVVVAAGGTHEPIDDVRFIGNKSSGKQGLALAKVAASRGAEVLLVNCNMSIEIPKTMKSVKAETASELLDVLLKEAPKADYLFMPVAVSDYKAATRSAGKIKREETPEIELHLTKNPDVLATVGEAIRAAGKSTILVGFAAEASSQLFEAAKQKLSRKNIHFIVANDISSGKVFGSDENSVEIFSHSAQSRATGTKEAVATSIIDFVLTQQRPLDVTRLRYTEHL
ncbi:MAG: bifunctional phosphopantothenoylcysteine decarboxylase/phosphopantothenate--cysteine ligase CoaBC [Rhodoluna sp.]